MTLLNIPQDILKIRIVTAPGTQINLAVIVKAPKQLKTVLYL